MSRGAPALSQHRHSRGMTLVELMVAITLGLLVIGAAIGIFVSNRQVYRAAENLNRVQESGRVAYELMARDIREATGNPCVNKLPLVNVVTGSTANWWSDVNWSTALRGFDGGSPFPDAAFGTAAGERLAGTDAIQLLSGADNVSTISAHDTAAGVFTLNTADNGFGVGDLAIACNARQAAVFQVTSVSGSDVGHAAGGGPPGNCTKDLGLPLNCGGGNVFQFAAPNSVLAGMHASRWFIANNPNGIPSLYQAVLGGSTVTPQEVAEGVTNMVIEYLPAGGVNYVPASAIGDWADVTSVRITLTLQTAENVGTDGAPVERQVIQVASLRNRNP